MNASPHAHTYDNNKKKMKRTNIYKYAYNFVKQMVIYIHKNKSTWNKQMHKTSLSPIKQYNIVNKKNDNMH